jgi:putative ABC transport system permease protein
VDRFEDRIVGDQLRTSLYVLLGAVAAVLLIGCANLANLALARGTSREREVAIRASLGAGRWRLVRQFLTENVLLSLAGGALGLALGYAMVAGLKAITPPFSLPSEASIQIDMPVLLFTLVISVVTGIIFGLAPALQAASPKLAETMKEGGHGSTSGSSRGRLRSALVITETALAFILLTGAGLLIRSFDRLMNVHTGFDTTNILTMSLPLSPTKIKDGDQAVQYAQRVMNNAGALPGVREVALTSALPLQGWGYGMPFQISGKPFRDRANRDACFFKIVSPSYFHPLGIALTRGRGLNDRDVKGGPPAAIINETMAKRFFKGEDPVGKRIEIQDIVYGKPNLGLRFPGR